MVQETWSERVVDRLAALKLTGCSFEQAWRVAMRENRPRPSDLGPEIPTLFSDEVSVVEFFRRACLEAWGNENPHLRHLGSALQDLAVEPSSTPARVRRRIAA